MSTKPSTTYGTGDAVVVLQGPSKGYVGEVDEIDNDGVPVVAWSPAPVRFLRGPKRMFRKATDIEVARAREEPLVKEARRALELLEAPGTPEALEAPAAPATRPGVEGTRYCHGAHVVATTGAAHRSSPPRHGGD